ncbi:hypothetical protein E2C01_044415 [Portunus trituberculatus]|uniref:Uncharacterized protein n=1 Tax=Portunus trituberculatus TaxID=210409 RepID=A0A5B7FZ62_PORTR|nr:hypothetical protein [Portunus trituberculatus]
MFPINPIHTFLSLTSVLPAAIHLIFSSSSSSFPSSSSLFSPSSSHTCRKIIPVINFALMGKVDKNNALGRVYDECCPSVTRPEDHLPTSDAQLLVLHPQKKESVYLPRQRGEPWETLELPGEAPPAKLNVNKIEVKSPISPVMREKRYCKITDSS